MKKKFTFIDAIGGAVIFSFTGVTCAQMLNGQLPVPVHPRVVDLIPAEEKHFNASAEFSHITFGVFEIKQAKVLIPGLFRIDEVDEIISTSRCSLPAPSELTNWATENIAMQKPALQGFYWTAPKAREVGFAYYMHLPSMKVVEFGSNVFQAHLLIICSKNAISQSMV